VRITLLALYWVYCLSRAITPVNRAFTVADELATAGGLCKRSARRFFRHLFEHRHSSTLPTLLGIGFFAEDVSHRYSV
jgi:hypothetical protein